uniref:Putative carboxymuconolactone decarboxylase n=1 Tax=Hydrogenophaga sp. PL2G6 TaxID=503997 RepID=B4Y345_9BURK|nr:putative carboxymuconolactone decarboxylase [Hydrogenophaga sp. PL2G6]
MRGVEHRSSLETDPAMAVAENHCRLARCCRSGARPGPPCRNEQAGKSFVQCSQRVIALDNSLRFDNGMQVLRDLNNGQPQPVFEAMRRDFPFLAEGTASYALGDVWGRKVLDPKTRQLAAMAAFASLGLRGFFKTHAGYALNLGATPDELKEIVYLVTVPAGFPRAIEASQVLQELFHERGLGTPQGQ